MHNVKFPTEAANVDGFEVVCIEAKRVCDFCFQEERIERTFPAPTTLAGTTATAAAAANICTTGAASPISSCNIDEQNITCRVVERKQVDWKKNQTLVCVVIEVPVTICVGTEAITQRVVFLKQAVLCAPAGTDIECQVTGDCCCFFDAISGNISCVFNFCVVIQSKVTVRVMVPTLGMCVPKRCDPVIGGCPPGSTKPCRECDTSDSSSSNSGHC